MHPRERTLLAAKSLLLGAMLAVPAASRAGEATYPPYSLNGTQVRTFHSNRVGIDYKLYVGLPRDYDASSSSYPVVMILDADSSFAMTHGILRFLEDHDELAPAILVGIAYPGVAEEKRGPIYKTNRTRDYTPTTMKEGGYGAEFQKVSGGADRFLEFIGEELVPYLEREFRVQPHDRAIVGHSYGGLLASYALLTRPGLFQRFVIVSPSLWWDRRLMTRIEKREAALLKSLPARAFFAVGQGETGNILGTGSAEDLEEFVGKLKSRHYSGLQSALWIAPDETHHSVFPGALTRGLRWVFKEKL
ncbi:MAG: alpha/beta hydrolase [Elusimicrobiota bacterium]